MLGQWQGVNSQDELLEMVKRVFDPKVLQSLNKDDLISPLSTIYDSRRLPNAFRDPNKGKEYEKLYDMYERIYEALRLVIPDNKRNLLVKLDENIGSMAEIEYDLSFQQGLRDGFLLAVELLAVPGENRA